MINRIRVVLRVSMVLTVWAVAGCSELLEAPSPYEFAAAPGGRGGNGPTVTAADPAFGYQGETGKRVRVLGSGFEPGTQAEWLRDGVPHPDVIVLGTEFVSPSELIATISIAVEADITLYDIRVTRPDRKGGIGTEMFEVTTAESLGTLGGNTWTYSINDAGQVVGYSAAGNGLHAFVWDESTGMQSIGPGQAWDIDGAGVFVVGTSGARPAAWTRSGSAWVQTDLSASDGIARAVANVGTSLVVVGNERQGAGRKAVMGAVTWTPTAVGWQVEALPLPAGVASGTASSAVDINARGEIIGNADGAVLWAATPGGPGATRLLDPEGGYAAVALGINDAGDVIVGTSSDLPVVWQKADGTWSRARYLSAGTGSAACGQQYAMGVNNQGWIAGRTCEGGYRRATLWRGPAADRELLPGLGSAREHVAAHAINDAQDPVIAGNTPSLAVRWRSELLPSIN